MRHLMRIIQKSIITITQFILNDFKSLPQDDDQSDQLTLFDQRDVVNRATNNIIVVNVDDDNDSNVKIDNTFFSTNDVKLKKNKSKTFKSFSLFERKQPFRNTKN